MGAGILARLIRRNWRVFARTPWAVGYALLPLLLTVPVYLLVLTGLHTDALPDAPSAAVAWLASAWTAAALPFATACTAALAAGIALQRDRRKESARDWAMIPAARGYRAVAYTLSVLLTAVLIAEATYIAAQTVVGVTHHAAFDLREWVFGAGYTALAAALAGAVVLLLLSLFRSSVWYAVLAAGAAVVPGLFAGAWLPVSQWAEPLASVLRTLPGSHAVAILRQALTWRAARQVFANADAAAETAWRSEFGLALVWWERAIPVSWSLLYLGVVAILATAASLLLLRRATPPSRLF